MSGYGNMGSRNYSNNDVMDELQGAGWQSAQPTPGSYSYAQTSRMLPMDGYPQYPAQFGPDASGRVVGQTVFASGFDGGLPGPPLGTPSGQGFQQGAQGGYGGDGGGAAPSHGVMSPGDFEKGTKAWKEGGRMASANASTMYGSSMLKGFPSAQQQSNWQQSHDPQPHPVHESSFSVAGQHNSAHVNAQDVYEGAVDVRYEQPTVVGERLLEVRRQYCQSFKPRYTFEKIVEVPQVVVKETERMVPKPEIVERIIEVPKTEVVERSSVGPPQLQIEERIVEVPQIVVEERVVHVPRREVQERLIEVPKLEFVEEIEYEDFVEYREVPVDKIVQVPEIEYRVREVEEIVPQDYIFEYFQDKYAEVPVTQVQEVERVEYVPIILPPGYTGPVLRMGEAAGAYERRYQEEKAMAPPEAGAPTPPVPTAPPNADPSSGARQTMDAQAESLRTSTSMSMGQRAPVHGASTPPMAPNSAVSLPRDHHVGNYSSMPVGGVYAPSVPSNPFASMPATPYPMMAAQSGMPGSITMYGGQPSLGGNPFATHVHSVAVQ